MSESEGRTCPECGTPRGPDGTPSCDCTERASEALREARTAEAAAAEDFDPLRIRPYVEVAEVRPAPPAAGVPSDAETRPVPAVEATLPLRAAPGPGRADPRIPAADGTDGPGTAELAAGRPRRSRRTVLMAAAGVGVAVVAAAGFAGGLFSYHTPSRDRAAEEVRESVPDATTPGPASAAAPGTPSAPRSPARSPSTPAAASPSPSTSAPPSPSPSPSASRGPSGSPSVTPSPVTVSATPPATPAVAPVLRRGDVGPEVTELQQRLKQLNLYGDRIDGTFTRPVEDAVRNYQLARGVLGDELGVYGRATRVSLEAETSQP